MKIPICLALLLLLEQEQKGGGYLLPGRLTKYKLESR
jgi:hypothetical protein